MFDELVQFAPVQPHAATFWAVVDLRFPDAQSSPDSLLYILGIS
jgi:hypothetical protein